MGVPESRGLLLQLLEVLDQQQGTVHPTTGHDANELPPYEMHSHAPARRCISTPGMKLLTRLISAASLSPPLAHKRTGTKETRLLTRPEQHVHQTSPPTTHIQDKHKENKQRKQMLTRPQQHEHQTSPPTCTYKTSTRRTRKENQNLTRPQQHEHESHLCRQRLVRGPQLHTRRPQPELHAPGRWVIGWGGWGSN